MLPAAFQPFVQDAPFCVLARAALESLFSREHLDELFCSTAQKQYTRELLFSQRVERMTAVVLQQQPSVLAAYRNGIGNITVSDPSVSNQLDGMELALSAALVRDSAQRVAPVLDALQSRQPAWRLGYRVRILDGNHLSATHRRLLPLRDAWDAPLPGKVLAVLGPRPDWPPTSSSPPTDTPRNVPCSTTSWPWWRPVTCGSPTATSAR